MKKKAKNKFEWYRRLRGVENYTPFWYLFGLPLDCVYMLIILIKKQDLHRYWVVKKRINLIRKQCKERRVEKKIYTTNTIMGVRMTPTTKKDVVKLYYKYTDTAILLKFRFFNMVVQKRDYERFTESCHVLTGLKITPYEINHRNGYAYFKLFENPTPVYKHYFDIDKGCLTVGTGFEGFVYWKFNENPHALIIGETGSGKTTFMNYLLSSLLEFKHVWILDGKKVDYSISRNLFERYVSNDDALKNLMLIEGFAELMNQRGKLMSEKGVKFYSDLNLEPMFLIMDEFIDIIGEFKNDKEGKIQKERMMYLIGRICRLGRGYGFQLIITMQRPDTTYIDGNARDQFQFKTALGSASPEAYNMALNDRDLAPMDKGRAWYKMGNLIDVISIPNYKNIEFIKENEENEQITSPSSKM